MLAWWDVLGAAAGRCDQSVYFQNSQKAFNQNTFYECSCKYVVVSVHEIHFSSKNDCWRYWNSIILACRCSAFVKNCFVFSTGVFRSCEEALGWWRRKGVLRTLQRISANRLCALVSMSLIVRLTLPGVYIMVATFVSGFVKVATTAKCLLVKI